ncbi:hypothetical protein [Leifsonia naganoensis]|uniref:hypothetical protein n=1 Tax=Leifsonia naganoensis TaxID=150025 RepID=UPI0015CC35DD
MDPQTVSSSDPQRRILVMLLALLEQRDREIASSWCGRGRSRVRPGKREQP